MRTLVHSAGLFLLCCTCAHAAQVAAPAPEMPARQILPVSLVPERYDLLISPDEQALTFTGELTVSGTAPSAGHQITLNARGLTFDEVRLDAGPTGSVALDASLGRATLTFPATYVAGPHALHIRYHGPITRGTSGFFAMDYDTPLGRRRTLATNFEPADARELLPCWDEPARKARFAVTVDAPADRMAISNMPIASTESLPDQRQRVHFAQTPPMSTYLLFLAVGDFERQHREVDGIDVGVVVKRGDLARGAYALEQAALLLRYYNSWFGIRYPLPKMDMVAAPGDITGGAMENWGALFYSQRTLLFDPASSSEAERQRVFLVVAHEMAHQWFGDLVTMEWWDELWLNEGFARWMQTVAADALHPEWKTGLAAAQIAEAGKRADAQTATHPVVQQVISVEQAGQSFDSITYDKGAAVITMLESYVGADAFRQGVRRYMKKHAYRNTLDADLWTQIAAASGKPVLDIERDFTLQAGVPLIRVETSGTGTRLVSGRFEELPESAAPAHTQAWRIPLRILSGDGKTSETMLQGTADLPDPAPLVNAGATAYVRVAYPGTIARSLAERIGRLSAADQLNLINDAWALAKSGYAPAGNLMEFLGRLPADADPRVWLRTLAVLVEIDQDYRGLPGADHYRHAARTLIAPLADALGPFAAGEAANRTTLRSALWRAQARLGDQQAIARAAALQSSGQGSPEDRRAALDIVAEAADLPTFERLLAQARRTSDPLEKSTLLGALAGARDPALSARMVDLALGPDAPAGSAPGLLWAAGRENPDAVWEALRPYFAKGPLPMDAAARWRLVPEIAAGSAEPGRIADVRAYGDKDMPADARRPVESAVGSITLNQRIRAQALPEISAWVANHS